MGEEEQHVTQGFFHQHWNTWNDVKPFQELSLKKLLEKVRELRDDLDIARTEVQRKTSEKLPPPLTLEKATTSPFGDRIATRRIAKLSKCWIEVESNTTDDGDSENFSDSSASSVSLAPLSEAVLGPAPLHLQRFGSA